MDLRATVGLSLVLEQRRRASLFFRSRSFRFLNAAGEEGFACHGRPLLFGVMVCGD